MLNLAAQRKWISLLFVAAFLWVISPLLMPVVMGGVIAVLMNPAHHALVTGAVLRKRGFSASASALFLTAGLSLLVLLPVAFLVFFVAKTGVQEFDQYRASGGGGMNPLLWTTLLDRPWAQSILEKVSAVFPISKETVLASAQDIILSLGSKVAEVLAKLFSALPSLSIALIVMILSLYFFMVDGVGVVRTIRRISPFEPHHTDRILKSITLTCRSVVLASLVAGVVQGLIFAMGCLVTGTSDWGLMGVLVFFASFIPLVGSLPLTIGVATYQLFLGNTSEAIWLYIFSGIVSASDNFIRPAFLKGAANLHPMIAFIAALGGIQVMGFFGIFLGPIFASAFLVSLEIIQER